MRLRAVLMSLGVLAALGMANEAVAATTLSGTGVLWPPGGDLVTENETREGTVEGIGDGPATLRLVLWTESAYGDCIAEEPGHIGDEPGRYGGTWSLVDAGGSRLAGRLAASNKPNVAVNTMVFPVSHCGNVRTITKEAGTTTLYFVVDEATGAYAGLDGGGVVRIVGVTDGPWEVNIQVDLH